MSEIASRPSAPNGVLSTRRADQVSSRMHRLAFALTLTTALAAVGSFGTSCDMFGCEDCGNPCPEGCTPGECTEGFSSDLGPAPSSMPLQWLTRLTVGGCADVLDEQERLVRIQCGEDRGSIFAEIFYDEQGHAFSIDVHDGAGQLESVSQHFDLVTDEDGRIIDATFVFLGEEVRVSEFRWEGERVASVHSTEPSGNIENTSFAYDEAGTLVGIDILPVAGRSETGAQQLTWIYDGESRPLTFSATDVTDDRILLVLRNVYDSSGTPPVRHERDDDGDGVLDEVTTFSYEDGELVAYDVDRAPLGSIDSSIVVSDHCCGSWCTPRE
jgi:hypothetical protein